MLEVGGLVHSRCRVGTVGCLRWILTFGAAMLVGLAGVAGEPDGREARGRGKLNGARSGRYVKRRVHASDAGEARATQVHRHETVQKVLRSRHTSLS